MSLIKKLFGQNSSKRKTGIYVKQGQTLAELEVLPGEGSINDITISLGYNINQVHTVFLFDSKFVSNIGVKIFTKEVVFVLTENGVTDLNINQLNKELNKIDWDFEYSSSVIESILSEGIEDQNLSFDYLSSIINLVPKTDSIFHTKKLDLYLHFEDGILSKYTSADGYSASSKWLKSMNSQMFESMLNEARRYQNSEMEIINEVNNQCDALQSIPNAIGNDYINEHVNPSGNYNFYNLWVAHYQPKIDMSDFMKMNSGRYVELSKTEIKVNDYVYQFSETGEFVVAWKK